MTQAQLQCAHVLKSLGWFALLALLHGCSGEASPTTSRAPARPDANDGGAPIASAGMPSATGTGGSSGGSSGGSLGGGAGQASAGSAGSAGSSSTGGATTGGSSSAGAGNCMIPPAASAVQGWAAVDGMNQNGTTGGGDLAPKIVTTLADFTQAVGGTAPAVIYLNAVLEATGIAIGSNKTIVGVCGAELHGHVGFNHAANVIVRNLKIVGYGVGDCTKDPAFDPVVGCSSGADAVSISSASHHIWVDHCDISDGTDGNLDINAGSDFITISWTKFHYSPRTDNVGNDSTGVNGHRFSNLIGSGDNVPEDVGHLNVTWHHDWWADNVNQRMPRTRRGKIHVVNNLYTPVGDSYCTNSGFEAHLLVENNVYAGVKNPLSPDANGDMLARNNVFDKTTGTTMANGTGFTPPYTLAPEATDKLANAVMTGAGPH
jgi:pectate lyase